MTCYPGERKVPQKVRRATAAVLAVFLTTALGNLGHAQTEACNVPDMITVGALRIEAVGDAVRLDPIDLFTTLKWTFALLLPELAGGEVGIYLYDPQSLVDSNVNLNKRHLLLFLVCNQGESYWARLGRIHSAPIFQPGGGDVYRPDGLYLGTTVPFPRSGSQLALSEVMRGDLRSFPPVSGGMGFP